MRIYKPSQNIVFVILALISALALFSEYALVSFVFFVLAVVFVIYEHKIYTKSMKS